VPFSVDPVTAAYAQQAQLAPQGFFGNLLGQIGQPIGSAVGSLFGQPNLGGQIGGFVGQLGRFLPFSVDPITAAYAQQAQLAQLAQLAPQGFFGNLWVRSVNPSAAQWARSSANPNWVARSADSSANSAASCRSPSIR
jgi:hypothetical protein